ncbi:hypothetical protein ACFLSZ_02980 [Candidatus Bipolaricaulota bacterium]
MNIDRRWLRWSTIGRSIDLRLAPNRAILLSSVGALLAGVVLALVRGEPWSRAAIEGLIWGGATFLGWAIGRETDPDRWYSAFFAAAGSLGCTILLGRPGFLFLLWFILAIRYVNRSTGAPPGVFDFVTLYGIKLWLGFTAHWTIPLLTFPTVFFAGIERFPKAVRVGLPLALPTAAVILGFTRGWHFVTPQWGWLEILVIAAIALATIPVIVGYRRVRSVGDRSGKPLTPHRVQWALGWMVAAAMILTLTGAATIQELAPVWAALAGTVIGWTIEQLRGLFIS